MADDWDTVTKIGSKTGGGSSSRETVVRGKGALNQAQRTGAIIGTEKKFATGNTVCSSLSIIPFPPTNISPFSFEERDFTLSFPLHELTRSHQLNKAGSEGQRLTKVDRSDDIVAPQKVPQEIGINIRNRRSKEGPYKMTQAQLAQKVNAQANDIKLLESGDAIKNQGLLNRVARVLKISPKTGLPLDDK